MTAKNRGEAFIMARFGSFAVVSQVIVRASGPQFAWKDLPAGNFIDESIYAKLRKLEMTPSAVFLGEGPCLVGRPALKAGKDDPDRLVEHAKRFLGSGKEGWRAEKPKAKYVVINVPLELASVAHATRKKKSVDAIRVEESDTISSLIFWDGKKYRYTPGGGTL